MCFDADDYCPYERTIVEIKEQFDQLAKEWDDQAMFHSFYVPIMRAEPCQQLIKLGEQIVPYIIERLESGNHWIAWCWLLSEITGVETGSGITYEGGFSKGNVHEMAEWWIEWYDKMEKSNAKNCHN